jgi:hypothetical protein
MRIVDTNEDSSLTVGTRLRAHNFQPGFLGDRAQQDDRNPVLGDRETPLQLCLEIRFPFTLQ